MVNREITLDYILQALRRRRYSIVLPATVITTAAIVFALILPNVYLSETVILVEPQQSVENTGGRPSVTISVERDRLNTLSQQILSRSRLEQIISQYGLYGQAAMEERVGSMREDIKLEVMRPDQTTSNVSSFKITYQHYDPRVATEVANRLASLFIEENTTARERMLGDRSRFLDEQLAQAKTKLDEQEQRVQEFKESNLSELPEQRDANLKMLEQLNAQLMANNDAINRAEQQRLYIETMLAQYRAAPSPVRTRSSEPPILRAPTAIERQLDELKGHLAELRSKYTDHHPDVVRANIQITELERKRANESAASTSKTSNTSTTPDSTSVDIAPEVFATVAQLNSQLRSIRAEIQQRNSDQARLQDQMNSYRARVELSPALDQQLTVLTRDYNVAKENYTALYNEKLSSQMAQDLESKQKAMLFHVLDPAKQPEKPYKPNRPLVVLIGLCLGLAAGLGFAFYREFVDETLRTEKELEMAIGLDVLATIPMVREAGNIAQ
ncbi:MAG: GNVR domain-containing protein [Acidobacteriota bacterium]